MTDVYIIIRATDPNRALSRLPKVVSIGHFASSGPTDAMTELAVDTVEEALRVAAEAGFDAVAA